MSTISKPSLALGVGLGVVSTIIINRYLYQQISDLAHLDNEDNEPAEKAEDDAEEEVDAEDDEDENEVVQKVIRVRVLRLRRNGHHLDPALAGLHSSDSFNNFTLVSRVVNLLIVVGFNNPPNSFWGKRKAAMVSCHDTHDNHHLHLHDLVTVMVSYVLVTVWFLMFHIDSMDYISPIKLIRHNVTC